MQLHALDSTTSPKTDSAWAAPLDRHGAIGSPRGSGHQLLLKGVSRLELVGQPVAPNEEEDSQGRRGRPPFLFHRPIRKPLEQLLVERGCILPYPIGPKPEGKAGKQRKVGARFKLPVVGQRGEPSQSYRASFGEPLDKATVAAILAENPRPQTRGECENGIRPCPWVSCRHHLMLEVNPSSGSMRINHRSLEDMKETCALDVAEKVSRSGKKNPPTLKAIGNLMGMSNERVRQIQRDTQAAFAAVYEETK